MESADRPNIAVHVWLLLVKTRPSDDWHVAFHEYAMFE